MPTKRCADTCRPNAAICMAIIKSISPAPMQSVPHDFVMRIIYNSTMPIGIAKNISASWFGAI
jgi:hypothetical protein